MAKLIVPSLIVPNTKIEMDVCKDKKYFQMGRHEGNDLVINSLWVSRFHAMIFRKNGEFYLINHSANGTFYDTDGFFRENSRFRDDSKLQDATCKDDFKKYVASHYEAAQEQKRAKNGKATIDTIPGFKKHELTDTEKVKYLIDMVNDSEGRDLLASSGVRLEHESYIGFPTSRGFLPLMFTNTEQGK